MPAVERGVVCDSLASEVVEHVQVGIVSVMNEHGLGLDGAIAFLDRLAKCDLFEGHEGIGSDFGHGLGVSFDPSQIRVDPGRFDPVCG